MSLWLPEDQQLLDSPQLTEQMLARYRRLLNSDHYVVWEWTLERGLYICEGNFWEKLGYRGIKDRMLNIESFEEYIHPDDWDSMNNAVLEHLKHDTPINIVYRTKAADGSFYWTQVCASSTRNERGRVVYLTGANFDLSHLKEAEKALYLSQSRHERVLASSNDGIWEWSATDVNENPERAGLVGNLHTSHSFWTHLGYSQDEADALPENERLAIWGSHIHPDDKQEIRRALSEHHRNRTPITLEYRIFGEGGNMFWLRTRGSGIFNSHGRMILMSGINIDITQEKESEERIRAAKEAAERANRLKSNFLSSISHELRTPLSAILGFSRLLSSDETLDPSHCSNATYIHNAGQHLLQLINDVLDLAQIEAGKLSLSKEILRPVELINESLRYCESLAQEKGITMNLHVNDCEDTRIYADPARLQQCLLNLINNAIKYNYDGGTVDVVLTGLRGDLEISIRDTGPGVPQEKQPFLFEMFNRLGAERSSVEGSGIGLVISQQLAIAMGGKLIYSDEVKAGACFKLLFPVANERYDSALVVQDSTGGKQIDLAFSNKKRIMYIEDNNSNIHLLKSWLGVYPQLSLNVATDPFVGLYQLRSALPDLILLDVNLPRLNGYDVLKILKQDVRTKHLPVIALSASAMENDIEQGLKMGFDEYLTKPLDVDQLSSVLNHFFVEG